MVVRFFPVTAVVKAARPGGGGGDGVTRTDVSVRVVEKEKNEEAATPFIFEIQPFFSPQER